MSGMCRIAVKSISLGCSSLARRLTPSLTLGSLQLPYVLRVLFATSLFLRHWEWCICLLCTTLHLRWPSHPWCWSTVWPVLGLLSWPNQWLLALSRLPLFFWRISSNCLSSTPFDIVQIISSSLWNELSSSWLAFIAALDKVSAKCMSVLLR